MKKRPSARDRGKFLTAEAGSAPKKSRKQEDKKMEREKVNWQLRPDLLKRVKHHAVNQKVKLYEVVEAALEQYLEKESA